MFVLGIKTEQTALKYLVVEFMDQDVLLVNLQLPFLKLALEVF